MRARPCTPQAATPLACSRALNQIAQLKQSLAQQVHAQSGMPKQLVHLTLTEAEALAWQTAYPHLLFPLLAAEKAAATLRWHARQQSIRAEVFFAE